MLLILLSGVLLPSTPALAAFANGTGIARIPNVATSDEGLAVAIQTDGRILVAGRCIGSNPEYRLCVARLNADGSADTSFDGGGSGQSVAGKVLIPTLKVAVGVSSRAVKLVIDSSGRIVVASTCRETLSSPTRFCIARLLSNGALDASFDGPDGGNAGNGAFSVPISATSDDRLFDIALQRIDGRIVLVGGCERHVCVARLRATDGSFDDNSADYGFLKPPANARVSIDPQQNGRGIYSTPSYFNSGEGQGQAESVLTTDEGKILLVGTCGMLTVGGASQICMIKFNRDGTFDDDFRGDSLPVGSGGRLVINTLNETGGHVNEWGRNVRMQADGRFLLQCEYFRTSSASQCMYRINSGGTIATSFSSGLPFPSEPGRVIYNTVGSALSFAITPPTAGAYANRVLALGSCSGVGGYSGTSRICVTAIRNGTGAPPNGDGTIDTSLTGPNGSGAGTFVMSTQFTSNVLGNEVREIVTDASGAFYVVGECDNQMCVYKFRPDGALDTGLCTLDVDGDGKVTATADGLAIVRRMLGVPTNVNVPTGNGYDVDGDGALNASRDGVLLLRRMLGFNGAALVQGVSFASYARRSTATDIGTYLHYRCGLPAP
ncbi:MAG: hypothetical protein JNL19_04535 [Burkholderiales bacterium]|nr:hypothetical protein [Burkholderiales bacterium]